MNKTNKAFKGGVADMTTQHIVNRIAWLRRHQVDPWDVVGDHDEFAFTVFQIEEQNERINDEIVKLEAELERRIPTIKRKKES